ncbi:NADH:flavin oxidoreductase [Prolixibacteraceae bacterium JC049]|nr:NADH:flavin oxidoreductase [Prolixibacteraceae bacterium JC049]
MQLLEKTKIRNLELNNRIIRSALWMNMADKDGRITPKLYTVYEELAKGGLGLIITGYTMVDANDRPNPGMMGIYDDSFIEEHTKLVDMVHAKGTPIALQVAYGGSQTNHPDYQDAILFGPSAVENRVTKITPKEMTKADIEHVVRIFTNAAVRAQKAGYDAIELHGAHGYLLSQFLTPFCNRRTDEYGGSIENRARIYVDVIRSIRQAVGEDFVVMVKMNHDDYMDEGEGLTVPEAIEVAKILEQGGADMLEISGVNETSGKGIGPARTKIHKPELQSYYLAPTKRIAEAVNIPVILMGGNRNFKRLQNILNETEIQYFSIARPLLCEPDLVNKWKADSDYKPLCVSCNGCYRPGEVGCVVQERLSELRLKETSDC